MKSVIDDDYLVCFRRLPKQVQRTAKKNYSLWKADPAHPSLDFKRVATQSAIYSVRIGSGWRALGLLDNDVIQWFWIGSHAEYDTLLRQM